MHGKATAFFAAARLAALCGAMCWTSIGAAGQVIPVTADAFGPHAVVETFEGQLGVTVEQDFILHDGGLLTYGSVQPGHVFLSGIAMSGQSAPPDAVWLFDWTINYFYYQVWNLSLAGAIDATTPLPSGTSFLGHKNAVQGGSLGFTLPAPAFRVGAFVEAWSFGPVEMRVFDAQDMFLGSHTADTDGATSSGLDTFLGVASGTPIVRVELVGEAVALDDLMFDPEPVLSYGAGCPGAGGFVPQLAVSGIPQVGAKLGLEISQGFGGSTAFLLSGSDQADLPLAAGSCSLLVAPVLATLVLPLRGAGAGAGAGSFSFDARVPTDAPVGLSGALQVWVLDSSASAGAASSAGVKITVLP